MIARKAEEKIRAWISDSNKALLVTGARQVGKTFSIRRSLREAGCEYIELNLIEQPSLVQALSASYTVKDLLINLSSSMTGIRMVPGETIIFIDEIQEFKDIVTRIKFWVDEGSFRFILSGSLLGVELKGIRSAPVGYIHEITMYPLDFEEFLRASSVSEVVLQYLEECFEKRETVKDPVHQAMMQHFRRYLVVGGMPEAVKAYIETADIGKVTEIQKDILDIYKLDFTKYELEDRRLMLISVFQQIPAQLLRQNRRFHFSDVQKKMRFERISSSFLWLMNAGVALPSYNASAPRVSLTQNEESSLFKLYSSDVGLLSYQYGITFRQKILLEDSMVNLGGIFENFIAQELTAQGHPLFFYLQAKTAELDFLIDWKDRVLPIEVKSGKEYKKHASLDKIMAQPQYELEEAFVFSGNNLQQEGKILYCPVYLCGCLKEKTDFPRLDIPVVPFGYDKNAEKI